MSYLRIKFEQTKVTTHVEMTNYYLLSTRACLYQKASCYNINLSVVNDSTDRNDNKLKKDRETTLRST